MAGNAENSGGWRGSRDTMKKLKLHARISGIALAIGVVVMLANMYVESEPGAIPLLVVVVSSGWYITTRVRMRAHHT